jgi:hypothetical protein
MIEVGNEKGCEVEKGDKIRDLIKTCVSEKTIDKRRENK